MDILMVEQAQIEPSYKRAAEKPAGSCSKQGFGRHMDSALGLGGRHEFDKAGPAGAAGTQLSDVASDSEVSDPSQAQPSQPGVIKEAALPAGPVGDEEFQESTGDDEAGPVPNPYALDAFLIPVFQQSPVKPMTLEVGVDPVSIAGLEGVPSAGNFSDATGVPQHLSTAAQSSVQAGMPLLESGLKAGDAIEDQGSGESGIDNLVGAFESTGDIGLQAGLEGSNKVPIAAEPSFQEISGLTIEKPADRTLSGPSSEIGAEGLSLDGLAEDVEMSHEEISVGGAIEENSGNGERDGFQSGNSGKEGNSDSSFSSGAQVPAQMEARTAPGFSVDQVESAQPQRTAESSTIGIEVIDRFADGVRLSVSNGMKEVRINMHPEELGGVTIRLRVDNGTVSAHVLIDSQSVKGIFDSDTGRLRDVFAQNGLVLDKFSVELSSGQGFTGSSSGGQPHRWAAETTLPPRFSYQEAAGLDSGRGVESLTGIGRPDGGIDLFA